jgi:hypothetical protein
MSTGTRIAKGMCLYVEETLQNQGFGRREIRRNSEEEGSDVNDEEDLAGLSRAPGKIFRPVREDRPNSR